MADIFIFSYFYLALMYDVVVVERIEFFVY